MTLSAAPVRLLDQNRALLRLEARVRNPRQDALSIEAADCALAVEGAAVPLAAAALPAAPLAAGSGPAAGPGSRVEGGGEAVIAFECVVRVDALAETVRGPEGPAEAPWSAAARVLLRAPDGAVLEPVAAASGAIPIVREPELRITSLRIERDVLVTTNLRLGLVISNPNAFPVELGSVSYDFYGEDRMWASGGSDERTVVPAKGRIERGLRFTMNFADADRRLFDLVAQLKTVRCRLAGSASVETDLEAIPSFSLGFDLEGACPVEQ